MKKTLPKNFQELLEENDIEKIKKELDKCDVNAYGDYSKCNALSFPEINEEIARYLIERGADINYKDIYKNTPLHHHSASIKNNIDLIMELGADIEAKNYEGQTPLHYAAYLFRTDNIEKLLKYNPNINTKDKSGSNILETILKICRNADIIDTVKISEILLNAGLKIENKEKIKKYVTNIGKNFEFYRADINKDLIDDLDKALTKLYNLFDVEAVPKKIVYDGVSPIIPTSKKWQSIHEELWNLLVSGKGHASTLQGEVIRISGKMSYEILDNGAINWNKDYRIMLNSFIEYMSSYNALEEKYIDDLKELSKNITEKSENEIAKLQMSAVKWVLLNPNPIKCENVKYKR